MEMKFLNKASNKQALSMQSIYATVCTATSRISPYGFSGTWYVVSEWRAFLTWAQLVPDGFV